MKKTPVKGEKKALLVGQRKDNVRKPKGPKVMAFHCPKGTRDFLPDEMEKRRAVFEAVRSVFNMYGYGEVSTPAFESLELLTCKGSLGDEAVKDIYRFSDKSERQLGLRYDPTTPIARIVASKPDMPKPIRWYYIANMWRYEDTSAGRYREFWQAGVELIGSSSPSADAEVLEILIDSMLLLGLGDFTIMLNNRQTLDAIAKKMKIANPEAVFRALDKLHKKGEEAVKEELKLLGLETKKINELLKFMRTDPAKIRKFPGIKDLERIIKLVRAEYRKFLKIDLSVVRGLDYYTGMVFETYVAGKEDIGSVASGGRYDSLIERYGGKPTPAIGFGIGIDRIVPILEEKGLIKVPKKKPVFVAPVSDEVIEQTMDIARKMRSKNNIVIAGFPDKNLSRLLEYAGKIGAAYCIIVGPNDLKDGNVTVRDMSSGEEIKVSARNVEEEIKKWERTKLFF